MSIYLILYLFFCAIIGFAGREQPLGFTGYGMISFFFTPVIGLLALLILTLNAKATNQQQKQ